MPLHGPYVMRMGRQTRKSF